jgi:hypothetical protein
MSPSSHYSRSWLCISYPTLFRPHQHTVRDLPCFETSHTRLACVWRLGGCGADHFLHLTQRLSCTAAAMPDWVMHPIGSQWQCCKHITCIYGVMKPSRGLVLPTDRCHLEYLSQSLDIQKNSIKLHACLSAARVESPRKSELCTYHCEYLFRGSQQVADRACVSECNSTVEYGAKAQGDMLFE